MAGAARARHRTAASLAARTVANKNVSEFRRQEAFRRRQRDIQVRYQPTAADTAAQALNAIALKRAREIIEGLPPRQRQIALMRWQDHMKTTEIAAELGLAEGTVHAHLHAARAKLTAGLRAVLPLRERQQRQRTTAEGEPRHDAPAHPTTTTELFVADFYPELGEYLAEQHATGYDAVVARTRFLLWLASARGPGRRNRTERNRSRKSGPGPQSEPTPQDKTPRGRPNNLADPAEQRHNAVRSSHGLRRPPGTRAPQAQPPRPAGRSPSAGSAPWRTPPPPAPPPPSRTAARSARKRSSTAAPAPRPPGQHPAATRSPPKPTPAAPRSPSPPPTPPATQAAPTVRWL